jgi:hypothetical protein
MWQLMIPKARHLAALVIFVPVLLFAVYLVAKNTDAYAEAERFVLRDERVAQSIGNVEKVEFKFWRGFEFGSDDTNFAFQARTNKGVFDLVVRLRSAGQVWRVDSVNISGPNGLHQVIR